MIIKILSGLLIFIGKMIPPIAVLFLLIHSGVNAQELHHQMLSSQGISAQLSQGLIVNATVGQTVIGSSESGTIVQQGYQQSTVDVEISQNPITKTTVKVFPNPFVDIVNFKFSEATASVVEISIFDISGKIILSKKAQVEDMQTSIDLSSLNNAQYLVKIASGPSQYYVKILKKIL